MTHHNNRSRFLAFLKSNLLSMCVFTTIITCTVYYSTIGIYKEIENIYKKETILTLDNFINTYKIYGSNDYEYICKLTNCITLTNREGDTLYNRYDFTKENGLPIKSVSEYYELRNKITNNKIQPFITFDNINVYSLTDLKLTEAKDRYIRGILFYTALIFFSGMLFIIAIRSYIIKFQGLRDKEKMEEKLRKRLTESVHHELSGPLSTIKSNLKAGFSLLYPCKKNNLGYCSIPYDNVVHDYCETCPLYKKIKTPDQDSPYWNYLNVMAAIDQMQAVLNIMANNKHIQYTNGSISLDKIMDNLISSKRLTTYNLVKVEVDNKEGLKDYSCGNGLNNGELLNIITSMVNNSIEAEANEIKISWEEINNNFINIYIKDNGYGVRDRKNRLIKDVKNFKIKYGYSTKVSPYDLGDMSKRNKIFKLFTNILGGNESEYVKVRGSGLHINKQILELAGGCLSLYENSDKGATFKITVPIKLVHFDELEKEVIKNV